MTQPVLEDWFSLGIRRNRKSFIFSYLILTIIQVLIFYTLKFFDSSNYFILIVFNVPILICVYTLCAQRLRDMNVTGWLALIWLPLNLMGGNIGLGLILIFSIILCCYPGTEGPNKYGDDPLTK